MAATIGMRRSIDASIVPYRVTESVKSMTDP
jgi:hypothetical protein